MPRSGRKAGKTAQNGSQSRGRRSDPVARVNKSVKSSPVIPKKRRSEPLEKNKTTNSAKSNTNASASNVLEAKRLHSGVMVERIETAPKGSKNAIALKKGNANKPTVSARFQEEDDVVEIELQGGQLHEFDNESGVDRDVHPTSDEDTSVQGSDDEEGSLMDTTADTEQEDEEGDHDDSMSSEDSVKIKNSPIKG